MNAHDARCGCGKGRLTRRRFLEALALASGGLALGRLLPSPAFAAGDPLRNRKFVFAYFEGGWDLLLGLDPRDPVATSAATHRIETGYEQLPAVYRARGLQRAGNLVFGPAIPPSLLALATEVSIVNGITMDTAAHEVGRRYFITGRFPRGLEAVGSSTAAEIAAQLGASTAIPHLSAGVEAYSVGLPSFAAPLLVNSLSDLLVALRPLVAIDPEVAAAVEAYQDQPFTCQVERADSRGLATRLRQSVLSSRAYLAAEIDRAFDVERTDPEMAALRQRYDLASAQGNPAAPEVLGLVAGQAIKAGVSQCVSVRVAEALDTHANWAADQAPRQERGWKVLAALIGDLKDTPSPSDPLRSLLEETTIIAFSEFGRTPLFNTLQGRDHFVGNSVLLAGAGVKHAVTIGQSAEVGMAPIHTDVTTGAPLESPTEQQVELGIAQVLTPRHVLATLLASAHLDSAYLRTEPLLPLLV